MNRNRLPAAGATLLLVLTGATGLATPAHAAASTSSTSLTLSTTSAAYGDTVTATARVVVPGETADGDVLFSVDGTVTKVNLGASGTASLMLDAGVGQHAVSASFAPRLTGQETSTSATAAWTVTRARTRLHVRVTGRGAHTPTTVVLAAAGEYGTLPTGQVTITVRHLKTRKVVRRHRTLDAAGATVARVGTLRTGAYRLRVSYTGDGQHLPARHAQRFTVRQR